MNRINVITLGVADLPRATAFYSALGFRKSESQSNSQISFFRAGGVVLGLFDRAALAEDAAVPAAGSGFSGITLAINLESKEAVAELLARAEAAGARITQPASEVFWGGYRGYCADLDGHLIEVCWNPFFPIDAAGQVQLPD